MTCGSCRSDTAPLVRQSALHVWKVVVSHTPKMLRTILQILFQILLGLLANNSADKRKVNICVHVNVAVLL